jgi:hypothetical protein
MSKEQQIADYLSKHGVTRIPPNVTTLNSNTLKRIIAAEYRAEQVGG